MTAPVFFSEVTRDILAKFSIRNYLCAVIGHTARRRFKHFSLTEVVKFCENTMTWVEVLNLKVLNYSVSRLG